MNLTKDDPFDFTIFKNLVGLAGNIFAIIFFITPALLMIKLHRKEQDPLKTPYFMMIMNIMNCVLWFSYGILKNDFFIKLANGIGFPLNTIYLCIYFFYRSEKNLMKSLTFIVPTIILGGAIFSILTYLVVSQDVSKYSAMVFNIFMYGAPGQKIVNLFLIIFNFFRLKFLNQKIII